MLKRSLIILLLLMIFNPSASANDIRNDRQSDTDSSLDIIKEGDLISRNIFIELGGPSLGVGLGYDRRFKPASVFGFRAGLSFSSISWSNSGWFGAYDGYFYTDVDSKGLTIPLELNAIMGKRASKFELGLGATPCIFHRHEVEYGGRFPDNSETILNDGTRLNIFGTLSFGYRLQRKSGFFLRVGLTFCIGDIKCSPIDGLILMPHLSLGYTIR